MKNVGKIVGINLLVLLLYSVIVRIINNHQGNTQYEEFGLGIFVMSITLLLLHILCSLAVSVSYYFEKDKNAGKAWMLNSGILTLVGGAACWFNACLQ